MEDWLPLPVPVEAAVNKEEVADFSFFETFRKQSFVRWQRMRPKRLRLRQRESGSVQMRRLDIFSPQIKMQS